ISECTEVLAREEREAPIIADATRLATSLIERPDCLSGILDHGDILLRRHLQDRIQVRHPPVQVNRDYRPCTLGDCLCCRCGVDIEGSRLDIYEHRARTESGNHTCGRKERVWRRDYLITLAHTASHQGSQECIGSRRHPNRVARAGIGGDFTLERVYFRTEDKCLRLKDLLHNAANLVPNGCVLRAKVQKWNLANLLRD